MAYIVEREFEHAGYKCVVVFRDTGYRCGYVGVPKESKLYRKSYTDDSDMAIEEIYNKPIGKRGIIPWFCACLDDKKEKISLELYFDVHGSLTYSGGGKNSKYPIESDLWWFGFDCAHWGDGKELKRVYELFPEKRGQIQIQIQIEREIYGKGGNTDEVIRSEEYVAEECKRLAEQIKEYEKREE